MADREPTTVDIVVQGDEDAVRRTLASLRRSSCPTGTITVIGATPLDHDLVRSGQRDKVLLGWGAEVHGNWLERLQAAAYAAADTGTVAPLTNKGPFQGYPFAQGADTETEASLDWAELDRWAAHVNARRRLEIPVMGRGCVYLKRAYLDDLAEPADQGRQRWRHFLAADVCMQHASVEAELPDWFTNAPPFLDLAAIASFVRADPARVLRRRLDLDRLQGPGPAVLFVTHIGGGGTERHVGDLARGLESEGVRALILRPNGYGQLRLERFAVGGTPNLLYEPTAEYYLLLKVLRNLGVMHIHVHHLLGHGPELARWIDDLGRPYDCTIHDYQLICPRIQLYDHEGRYCGEPEPAACNACLAKNGNYHLVRDSTEITNWRARGQRLLAGARRVFVPHADVAQRLGRYFPDVAFTERPHFESLRGMRRVAAPRRPGDPLRVILLGTLALHKGANLLLDCARDAQQRGLRLEYRVVGGPTHRAEELAEAGVILSGEYEDDEVFDRLEEQAGHCALFLSTWPETYCYTLSIAQAGGLYALGFDLGAVGARIRQSGWGEVFPWPSTAMAINDRLLAAGERLLDAGQPPQVTFARYHSLIHGYYELGEALAPHCLSQSAAA
jgi:glycosyltransferase involved in cell wall biosynthesis